MVQETNIRLLRGTYPHRLRLNTPKTKEEIRNIIAEERNRERNALAFAVYSSMFLNDFACMTVVELYDKLRAEPDVFRHELKYAYKLLHDKQRAYTKQFNSRILNDMHIFVDKVDLYEDEMKKHFDMLRMSYINSLLKSSIPYPYIAAELLYVKDCITIAIANYMAWMDELKKRCPFLYTRTDFSFMSIQDWEQSVNKLNNAFCVATHIAAGKIEFDSSQVELAQKVITNKVSDLGILFNILEKE